MGINKIVYGGVTKLDISNDTVTPSSLLQGYTAHDNTGALIIGTATGGGSGVILFTDNNAEMLINQEIRTWSSSTDYYYKALNVGNIIANETYVVVFDDVSYKYTPTGKGMGNIHAKYPSSTSPDTGEPFYINNEFGTYIYIYIQDNNTHDVKLAHLTSASDVSQYSDAVISVLKEATTLQTKYIAYTPTESAQSGTITADSGYDGLSSVDISVGAISSTYVGSGITRRSSTDLTTSGATVTVPSGYYSASASKSVASGTAGTPTATKGTVSNHSVSVTPSVTNTTGYITGGTKTGTAVTVSASELVSGTETKTENGTYDVTNLASVVVNVSGSSSVQTGIGQAVTGTNDSLIFAVLGNPTSFSLIYTGDITIGETPIVSAIAFDGTDYVGQIVTNTANAQASYISTGFSHTYYSSEQGIQINSTDAVFSTYSNYKLVYTYGGSSSDIHTANVQVGSGATSITFPSLSGRPIYWSCVFKSNFSTSSGYQRVIATGNDGSSTYGMCLDSSAHASSSYWTASYSGGSLTISSKETNQGGYFHQPGYYQLTYAVDDSAPEYQTKTVTPTTSQQIVTPDTGYDALSQVTVNAIPSGSAGTPTATKGPVSNHSVSVTPSVTNTTGYISGGTKTGTAVTVTASELVSGTKTVTTTGTSDVTNYASVNVDISFSTIYSGTSDPSSSLGVNGDIYLKVVE